MVVMRYSLWVNVFMDTVVRHRVTLITSIIKDISGSWNKLKNPIVLIPPTPSGSPSQRTA